MCMTETGYSQKLYILHPSRFASPDWIKSLIILSGFMGDPDLNKWLDRRPLEVIIIWIILCSYGLFF